MPGVIVRSATVDDALVLAVVQTRSWQEAYRGKVPQQHLDQLDPSRRRHGWLQLLQSDQAPAGTLVADHPDDGVVGFINVGPGEDTDTDPALVGQVRAIYILPEHWGRGAGRLLMNAGLDRLEAGGYREVVLWVLEANDRARRFYEAGGWQIDGASRTNDSRGAPLVEVRYRHRQAAAAT
ncbi:GNAT family N-acetyltransferase [Actinoplanes auranticolor]|uniref:GNAT family N-acetyltransferase n=1 Tax=Actinoplanes auranticolor TaxID=47988 RepID=UPI002484B088|nr:GNAT family N-acetyltransferase [Actinoplanes auranticolor]